MGVGDRLFHTLDPTTRTLKLGGRPYLLTDTVGFISKLPHQLVDAFGATLEETRRAELLAHVLDGSAPEEQQEEMQRAVELTLEEIGAGEVPRLLVLNKVDLLDEQQRHELRLRHPDAVLVSGHTGEGLEELGERIERELLHTLRPVELLVPYSDGGSLAELHELAGEVEARGHARGRARRRAAPSAARRALRALRRRVLTVRQPRSALVAAARRARRALAREQLLEVRRRDLVEVETELAGDLGDVPEDVAELLGQGLPPLLGDRPAVVADRLLGVLGHLARLAGESERGVGEPRLARVLGGAPGQSLVLG